MGTGPVGVPPDVTVLHNPPIPPPPLLSTFSYPAAMETEGHLVWPSENCDVGGENPSHIVFQLRLWSQCLPTATNQTVNIFFVDYCGVACIHVGGKAQFCWYDLAFKCWLVCDLLKKWFGCFNRPLPHFFILAKTYWKAHFKNVGGS